MVITRLNIAAAILAASFFVGFFVANAQNPDQNPPDQSIGAPISPSAPSGQVKLGGIGVNSSGNAKNGLIVFGDPSVGTGRVTIGKLGFSPPAGISREQLEVQGNLGITGILKPNGDSGNPGKVLERTLSDEVRGDEITWEGRGWLTITGDWSPDYSCTGASPLICTAFGLREYSIYCLGVEPGYSAWVRVCRE